MVVGSKSHNGIEQRLERQREVDESAMHPICAVDFEEVMIARHLVMLKLKVFLKSRLEMGPCATFDTDRVFRRLDGGNRG